MSLNPENSQQGDYRILGLNPGAGREDVKKAYRDLVKRWHPDRFQQQTSLERYRAEEKIKEITAAYRRISKGWSEQRKDGRQESVRPETPKESRPRPRTARPERPWRASAETARHARSAYSSVRSSVDAAVSRFSSQSTSRKLGSAGIFVGVFLFLLVVSYLQIPRWTSSDFDSRQSARTVRGPGSARAIPPRTYPPPSESSPAEREQSGSSRPSVPPDYPPPLSDGVVRRFFTLGSSPSEVLRIQGPPERVQGQTWMYGLSEVHFREGRLVRYNNFDGSLRVLVEPERNPDEEAPAYFSLGSTRNDVLLVQGTPTRVEANKWQYGLGEIHFKNGRVEGYRNYFGNLRVRMVPSVPDLPAAAKGYFTVGSTPDDVLAVQGTPGSVQGNLWHYELSSILFRDGKVHYVLNTDGNLHYVPLDDLAGKDKGGD